MKIPSMLQERLNCRSSELFLSHCLGNLYMQFLAMDETSKARHNTQPSKSSTPCHSDFSRTWTSDSSPDEITYSPSEVQSAVSGVPWPEVFIPSDIESEAVPKEEFCSADINPVSYNLTVSGTWKTPLRTSVTSQLKGSSEAPANIWSESWGEAESTPFENYGKGRTLAGMNSLRVKLICSFGGKIIPRPYDAKLRYVGGETRIIAVIRNIRYSELMYKLTESYGIALTLKYRLPDDDLDALVSVSSEDDLQNMMEEHDRLEAAGGFSRLRLFLFPAAEYDDYRIQNSDEDALANLDQLYVDAVNGVPGKSFPNHFESCLTGSAQHLDERFFPDSISVMPNCAAADIGAQESSIPCISHWKATSLHAFHGTLPERSSAPSSPPMASRRNYVRQNPAASDISLQYFQDRFNKVHLQVGAETPIQDFDQVGSGHSTSHQYEQNFLFSDPLKGNSSPTSAVFQPVVARGEHLHAIDSISELMESPCKSYNVCVQPPECSAIVSNEHAFVSDAQQHHEMVLTELSHPHWIQHQQQQQYYQHIVLQKEQHEENIQRMGAVQHDIHSQCQAIQQLSLHTSHLHSHNSTHISASRQLEQKLIYREDCLPGTSLQRSASSHALGVGGGQTIPAFSCASTYQMVAAAPSVMVGQHNPHVQHQSVWPNRNFINSCIENHHGRRVHYGDQNSGNLQTSIRPSQLLGNMISGELVLGHQQQHHILFSEAELQEVENSTLHPYERPPASWNQPCDSTACSPLYDENSVPVLEERTQCQVAGLDRTSEESSSSNQQYSRPAYHSKMKQVVGQALLYPGYVESNDHCGDWIGIGTASHMGCTDKKSGLLLEGGTCVEGDYDLSLNHVRDDFDSPTGWKCGVASISGPRLEQSLSSGLAPMTSYLSCRALHAATVSRDMSTENFQLDPFAESLRLGDPDQLSSLATSRLLVSEGMFEEDSRMQHHLSLATSQPPAGFHMFLQQKSSDPALSKADSFLATSATCLRNDLGAFRNARDADTLLNGAYKFENPSTCSENSQLQDMYVMGNPIASLCSSPKEVDGWITDCPVDNVLGANVPDFLPNIFETIDSVQPNCETISPCMPIHKRSSDSFEGSVRRVSTAAAPWDAFYPVANIVEQHEPSDVLDLPIYDRSPAGSVNIITSRNEAEYFHGDPDKSASAGGMSLTGRLAEDMICSVLESCGNGANYKDKVSNDEEPDETPESHNRMIERKEGLRNISKKNISSSPTMQDAKRYSMSVKHLSGVTTNVQETLGVLSKENGSFDEIKETLGHFGVRGSNDTSKKCSTCCAAEKEAISHGLQIIKNADLEEIRELGSGTFGTVYHGKWRGCDVAIKRIKASCFTGPLSEQERLISDFWKEACTLAQLHHPNVVAFYGIVPDGPDGTLATVTEYMVNGSLKQVLHKKDRTIDRRKRLLIAMDIAFGMEYLHGKSIVHFDLKCENLLVNMRDPHRPICKVGDFGLSKVKQHTLVSGGVRGTLPWMAPELLSGNNSKVTEKIDVFSFGIVMWELLTGEEPYANLHCGAIIGGIVNNTLRPPVPCWCDPAWRSLMEQCWSACPVDRPSFSEVASELRGIAATMNLK